MVGRSGHGKTYTLKVRKLPRVAYIECDDTEQPRPCGSDRTGPRHRAARDDLEARQRHRCNRTRVICSLSTRPQARLEVHAKKMEILRGVFDQADVGLVIAGEPKLSTNQELPRAHGERVDFYTSLRGLKPAG
ncbi:MAG: hypothetical protein ACLVL7_05370 [Anaerotruncus massiliensis (ex Togo et al. 2019)]